MSSETLHQKMDWFAKKLQDAQNDERLRACLGNGIKRAFCRLTYSETFDPLIPGEQKIVRDFKMHRMLTGKKEILEECDKILDEIFETQADTDFRVERKYTITDQKPQLARMQGQSKKSSTQSHIVSEYN